GIHSVGTFAIIRVAFHTRGYTTAVRGNCSVTDVHAQGRNLVYVQGKNSVSKKVFSFPPRAKSL
ncbi:MAG: hypothetical protein WBK71_05795, partial [Acetomicrobium sp.]